MKFVLAVLLCVAFKVQATPMKYIKNPTDEQCRQYMVYKEARGDSLKALRAVLDVLDNRMATYGTKACKELKKAGQYPYFKYGVKLVKDKEFLTKYDAATRMAPILTDRRYIFFNSIKHSFATGHKKIGHLYFSRLKEKR